MHFSLLWKDRIFCLGEPTYLPKTLENWKVLSKKKSKPKKGGKVLSFANLAICSSTGSLWVSAYGINTVKGLGADWDKKNTIFNNK